MSRIAKAPIPVPDGVEIRVDGRNVEIEGTRGTIRHCLHASVGIEHASADNGTELMIRPIKETREAVAQAGTARSLLNNMVIGVTRGFERRLQLVGVGYRAQSKDGRLNMALGYSHPIEFNPPEGVTVEATSNTEIVVRGVDKQKVGQAAAVIRGFRPPEPYKGKGVRYADEVVRRKEAKKK
ncbi:MAG: 50S ribosomal protein L6 [Immundisolibacterales bacterium]|nr:50S ribosomal protein L6 [Immundisolibacterales bacterium]